MENPSPTRPGPLNGIKVLDLTRLAPGPHCTMILGDLGAEIIKVEEPGAPVGRRAQQAGPAGVRPPAMEGFGGSPFNALNRNKKSIGLNLKSPAGKQIFLRLAQRTDVIVEEFRPGVAKRLGIDFDTLSVRSPRIIYCAVTGYGQNGPHRSIVGHDINYIGAAGALSLLSHDNQPPTIPFNLIADYAGGGMHAALGIMAALLARVSTGRGQMVDASMLDGTMLLMAQTFSSFYASGKTPRPGHNALSGGVPHYNTYRTSDGKFITIGALEPWFYANLFRALGREDYVAQQQNPELQPEIKRFLTETFATRSRDEWVKFFGDSDVCVAPMLTLDEVEHHPQVRARNMIVELEGPGGARVKQVGVSLKLSETPGSVRSLAPTLGQHTDEILAGLGYTSEAVAQWRQEGAVK